MKFSLLTLLVFFALEATASLEISQPLIKWVKPSRKMTAGYFHIKNNSNKQRVITGASSSIARKIELHTHLHEKGVMKMRKVDSVKIAPQKTVKFKPMSFHLMLFGLQKELKEGDKVKVRLEFKNKETREEEFIVSKMYKNSK